MTNTLQHRPTRVTAISVFALFLSAVQVFMLGLLIYGISTQQAQLAGAQWLAFGILIAMCPAYAFTGWMMLQGRNIARWLFLALCVGSFIQSMATESDLRKIFFQLLILVWALFALLTPPAEGYFSTQSKRASKY